MIKYESDKINKLKISTITNEEIKIVKTENYVDSRKRK